MLPSRSGPPDGPALDQLERILASSVFQSAERDRRFLQFVVTETLAGRQEELSAPVIAAEVFETSDSATDAKVRSQAGRLRDRLRRYYDQLGGNDPVRIDIPTGGYVPTFAWTSNPSYPSPGPKSLPVLIGSIESDRRHAVHLAAALHKAGYGPIHVELATSLAAHNGPLVFCVSVNAIGTGWVHKFANGSQGNQSRPVVFVQVDPDAYLDWLTDNDKIAVIRNFWDDAEQGMARLLGFLRLATERPIESATLRLDDSDLKYCDLLKRSLDIADLAVMPTCSPLSGSVNDLRRLYVPLRVTVQQSPGLHSDADIWSVAEQPRRIKAGSTSVAEIISRGRQLVVLGEAGSGKSTLLRWLATIYLLRLTGDASWQEVPGVSSLPPQSYFPIFIRCRDLSTDAILGSLEDMLSWALRKLEVPKRDIDKYLQRLVNRLESGQAIVLIDGLDELSDPMLRTRLCRQLNAAHIAHPDAAMLITSRPAEYRQMQSAICRNFQHVVISDLPQEDKVAFVRQWFSLAKTDLFRSAHRDDLIAELDEDDAIGRLASSPLMLNTLVLLGYATGRMPRCKAQIYGEVLQVLLTWGCDCYRCDPREALPPLKYLAYEMWRRQTTTLPEDDVIAILTEMRQRHVAPYGDAWTLSVRDWLTVIKTRGVLIQAGSLRSRGLADTLLEFRHPVFQAYLTALAILDRCHSDSGQPLTTAEHICSLIIKLTCDTSSGAAWVEDVVRLCLGMCDEVTANAVLQFLTLPDQPGSTDELRQAVLACMCLSDNVVVAEDIAVRVIMQLLSLVRVHGCSDPVGVAVKRLALSRWGVLCEHLVAQEFEKRLCCPEETGILYCLIAGIRAEQQMQSPSEWASACTILLRSPSQAVAIGAAMATVYLAYNGKASFETGLADALLALLQRGAAAAHAAAWALVWLGDPECFGAGPWIPTEAQLSDCIRRLSDPTLDACAAYYLTCLFRRHCSPFAIHVLIQELQHASADVRRSSAIALRKTRHPDAVEHLCAALADPAPSVRIVVAESLGAIGDIRAVEFLVARLSDDNREVRRAVAYALGHLGSEPAQEVLRRNLSSEDEYARKDALGALSLSCRTELDRMLLSRDFDGFQPFLDPSCPINEERIREAAKECLLSIPEVRERYWSIASRLQLSSMLPIGDTGAATTVSCLN